MNRLLGLLAVILMLGTASVSAIEMYQGIDGKDVGWTQDRGQRTCLDKFSKHNIGPSTNVIDQQRFLSCLRNSEQTPEVIKALKFWSNDDMRVFWRYVEGRGSGRGYGTASVNGDVVAYQPAETVDAYMC